MPQVLQASECFLTLHSMPTPNDLQSSAHHERCKPPVLVLQPDRLLVVPAGTKKVTVAAQVRGRRAMHWGSQAAWRQLGMPL